MLVLIIKYLINIALSFIEFMVLAECVCSWIPGMMNTSFYAMISKFTSPLLNPIRDFMYKRTGGSMMIDFSPMILFLLIGIAQQIVAAIL